MPSRRTTNVCIVSGTGQKGICIFADTVSSSDPNNASVVLRLDIVNVRFLFPGDVEPAAQDALVHIIGRVDVLKLAHHGSAKQSAALAAVARPTVVTVSVGLAMAPSGEPCLPLELMHRADSALYAAKHSGRNRVACLQDPPQVRTA